MPDHRKRPWSLLRLNATPLIGVIVRLNIFFLLALNFETLLLQSAISTAQLALVVRVCWMNKIIVGG